MAPGAFCGYRFALCFPAAFVFIHQLLVMLGFEADDVSDGCDGVDVAALAVVEGTVAGQGNRSNEVEVQAAQLPDSVRGRYGEQRLRLRSRLHNRALAQGDGTAMGKEQAPAKQPRIVLIPLLCCFLLHLTCLAVFAFLVEIQGLLYNEPTIKLGIQGLNSGSGSHGAEFKDCGPKTSIGMTSIHWGVYETWSSSSSSSTAKNSEAILRSLGRCAELATRQVVSTNGTACGVYRLAASHVPWLAPWQAAVDSPDRRTAAARRCSAEQKAGLPHSRVDVGCAGCTMHPAAPVWPAWDLAGIHSAGPQPYTGTRHTPAVFRLRAAGGGGCDVAVKAVRAAVFVPEHAWRKHSELDSPHEVGGRDRGTNKCQDVSREEVTGVAHQLEDVACKQKAVIQSRRLTWKALSKYFAAAELDLTRTNEGGAQTTTRRERRRDDGIDGVMSGSGGFSLRLEWVIAISIGTFSVIVIEKKGQRL
ncbi:hypothetical protein C8J57DRAFT_1463867 [Mycena rebaudengoi]|nr:hypothetical protein C8J57DRAFT_1463867 [Mycena rebaudengoi]